MSGRVCPSQERRPSGKTPITPPRDLMRMMFFTVSRSEMTLLFGMEPTRPSRKRRTGLRKLESAVTWCTGWGTKLLTMKGSQKLRWLGMTRYGGRSRSSSSRPSATRL